MQVFNDTTGPASQVSCEEREAWGRLTVSGSKVLALHDVIKVVDVNEQNGTICL